MDKYHPGYFGKVGPWARLPAPLNPACTPLLILKKNRSPLPSLSPPIYDDSHHHKQVGMRHFHTLKNRTYTKAVNVEKLWSLLGDGVYEQAKASKDKAPVLDVTKLVRGVTILIKTYTYNLPVVCGRNGHTSLHPHM